MRWNVTILLIALAASGVHADDDHARALKEADAILRRYFLAVRRVEHPKARSAERAAAEEERDEALAQFRDWLERMPELRARPRAVLEILDRGRIAALPAPATPGKIEIREGNGRGIERDFFYAALVPPNYRADAERYPLVVALHDRIIERVGHARGAVAIADRWLGTPTARDVVVVAPGTDPTGFGFEENAFDELKLLYRALRVGLQDYRTDWDRVVLDVAGSALRVACEQPATFAGVVLRDREDDREVPCLPDDQLFMLENLNGAPLYYLADQATWARVGQPLAAALQRAYGKAGKLENLTIRRVPRENGILTGGPAVEHELRDFVTSCWRPRRRDAFTWRFFSESMTSPLPLEIVRATARYEPSLPREATAGAVRFAVTKETYDDGSGARHPFSRISIEITEAEKIRLNLSDDLVDLDHPVTLVVNGETVLDRQLIERDWDHCLQTILPAQFFMFPYVAQIEHEFPLRPQHGGE